MEKSSRIFSDMSSNGFGDFGWNGPIIFLKMFWENQNGFSYFYVIKKENAWICHYKRTSPNRSTNMIRGSFSYLHILSDISHSEKISEK